MFCMLMSAQIGLILVLFLNKIMSYIVYFISISDKHFLVSGILGLVGARTLRRKMESKQQTTAQYAK